MDNHIVERRRQGKIYVKVKKIYFCLINSLSKIFLLMVCFKHPRILLILKYTSQLLINCVNLLYPIYPFYKCTIV